MSPNRVQTVRADRASGDTLCLGALRNLLVGLTTAALLLSGVRPALADEVVLSGSVATDAGQPVDGVLVTVEDAGVIVAEASTATDGTYGLAVESGFYDVIFTPPDGSGFAPIAVDQFDLTRSRSLYVVLAPADTHVLSGSLVDEDGAPVVGANVIARPTDGAESTFGVTDATGTFEFSVRGGASTIFLNDGGGRGNGLGLPNQWSVNTGVVVDVTGPTSLDLVLPTARVEVQVLAPDGSPVPDAETAVFDGGGPIEVVPGVTGSVSFGPSVGLTDASGIAVHKVFEATSVSVQAVPPADSPYLATRSHNRTIADNDRVLVSLQEALSAAIDTYEVEANSTLDVPAPGVLENDSAPGSNLTASLSSAPAHGTVSLASDGSFVYTPFEGFTGIDTFTYAASDGTRSAGPVEVTITVTNPLPTLTEISPDTVVEGTGPMALEVAGTGFTTQSGVLIDGEARSTTYVSATRLSATVESNDVATPGTVSVQVVNPAPGGGDSNVLTLTVEPANRPPTAEAGPDVAVDEGDLVVLDASGSADPDGDPIGYEWVIVNCDWTIDLAGADTVTPSFTPPDDGACVLELTATDEKGASSKDQVTVAAGNVPPVIGTITGPDSPQQRGTVTSVNASFMDRGIDDTHTASVDWGDGTVTAATVAQEPGGGTVSGSHVYQASGMYTITVTVSDDDAGSGSAVYEDLVIYDPEGGFATGGGWIDSPPGACQRHTACADATGNATFSFVAKYQQGATVPTGETRFRLPMGGFDFRSTAYEWLVIDGTSAKFQGSGTVGGSGGYSFMLTATDASPDTFRIKIWDTETLQVIYDNLPGTNDSSHDGTPLGGGGIGIQQA